ncbi:MAG: SRPBCC domain-containing protein [Edaphobacter sp.]
MTQNTASEVERMVVTRVFDAPRELVWKAWTDPKYIMQWWGPKGFTATVCEMDFRVGGKLLCCMKAPDGQICGWNAVEYYEIVLHEKIVSSMYFSDSKGNKIDPAELGMEYEVIDGAYDVTIFEDLGNGQTRLTHIGNEPMESAKNSGQLEGWNEILDKVSAVVAELAQAK